MIGRYVKGRVYVFIDAANILYSQKTLRWRVDYKRLKEYFLRECELKGIFFYTGRLGLHSKQNKFLQKLTSCGYVVKAKEVKRIEVAPNCYEWKGNLDVELTIDVLKNSPNFDTCILMSGDSDFASLLDELKGIGKRVIVMSTRGHISKELLDRAKYLDLRKLRDLIAFDGWGQKKSGASLTGSPEVWQNKYTIDATDVKDFFDRFLIENGLIDDVRVYPPSPFQINNGMASEGQATAPCLPRPVRKMKIFLSYGHCTILSNGARQKRRFWLGSADEIKRLYNMGH